MYAVDTIGVPGLTLLKRTKEHLIQTERVGTIALDDHIGVDDIVHRLTHLLDGPSADVLAILEDEVSRSVLGAPSTESFKIELIVVDDIHIHMEGGRVVLILEAEGDEGIRVLDAVDEVGAPLDHPLIDQLTEGLVFDDEAEVIDELIPEAAIDEVTGSMLCTSYIEVYMAPVGILVTTDKRLVIVRIHIAEVIGRATSEARHCAQLVGEAFGGVPTLSTTKRGLTIGGGEELIYLGEAEGQFIFADGMGCPLGIIIDGEGLTPVALTAEDRVA